MFKGGVPMNTTFDVAGGLLTAATEIASETNRPRPEVLRTIVSNVPDPESLIWTQWRKKLVEAAAQAIDPRSALDGLRGCVDALARDVETRDGTPRVATLKATITNTRDAETSRVFALAFGELQRRLGDDFKRA
jgi:hypothetical protein